ncbi:hypothetical protein B7463_g860, partial [Scytalidium lignicola]
MPYNITKATTDHIPGILEVWISAFSDITAFFPHSPTGDEWLLSSFHFSMTEPSQNTVYYVMTDDASSAPEDRGEGKVLGFAKWTIHPGGKPLPDWRERWEKDFPADMSSQLLGSFFDPMARQHDAVVGDRPHYFLETLATIKKYWKRGLGSSLLQWGNDEADKAGWECYLDAAPTAKHLYEMHGYAEQTDKKDPNSPAVPMLRTPNKQ